MGQRLHPMVYTFPKDDRGWRGSTANPKDIKGKPVLPPDQSGFREERIGSSKCPHLRASVEYIVVNVGGLCGEGSSPPMKHVGVGGVIVLGARESRAHGEGRQGIDIRRTNSRRSLGEVRVALVK
jgi:hypothetical protein